MNKFISLKSLLRSAVLLILITCAHSASASTLVSSPLTGNTTWTKADSPYVVSNVTIPAGITLTIEPGVVVKMSARVFFYVFGTVNAQGTAAEPIIFTAITDDSVGGDSNGDLGATLPNPGDWLSLYFLEGSQGTFVNTEIRYGGASNGATPMGALHNQGGTLALTDCTLTDALNYPLAQESGTTTLTASTIERGGSGLRMTDGVFALSGNTFTDNLISIDPRVDFINHGNNTGTKGFSFGGQTAANLSGTMTHDQTWVPDGLPYVVADTLTVPALYSLTILPGTVVHMTMHNLTVSGTLTSGVSGASERVTFTSPSVTPQPGDWMGINFLSGSHGAFHATDLRYGAHSFGFGTFNGMVMNQGGTITMDDTTLTDAGDAAIHHESGTLAITASTIANAPLGIRVWGGTVELHDSSVHDLSAYGVYNIGTTAVDATHNWWGSFTGPTHPSHPIGTGVAVSNNVLFLPYRTIDPTDVCTVNCNSNVLFLPGIEASRMYEPLVCNEAGTLCKTEQLWEPHGDRLALRLGHEVDGSSTNADIYVNGIIDNAYAPIKGNIYKSFIEGMNAMATSGTINAWETVPYDWRLTPDQILSSGKVIYGGEGITYLEATSSPYIIQELKKLAESSKTKKVTIIAHSNGGLIAKALTEKLGTTTAVKLIDKIIFVAVPQVGTPKAIGSILHGFDQGIGSIFIGGDKITESAARVLARNMPMAYNLLPSADYFTYVDDPVVTFSDEPEVAIFRERYGEKIHSKERLHPFLVDSFRLASSTVDDLQYPSVGNDLLLTHAESLHQNIDKWVPPSGIKLYEIAGWGLETVSAIEYYQGEKAFCSDHLDIHTCIDVPTILYNPKKVLDGDGTVVVPSALWTAASTGVSKYWVDLKKYGASGLFGSTINRKHADILEVDKLRAFIQDIVTGESLDNLDVYKYISTSTPINNDEETQLAFSLHSPLRLDVYDNDGNHTGISTSTGLLEENIPGSHYETFGEVKYISIPASLFPRLVLRGYETGSFTLDLVSKQGERIMSSTTFSGIPSFTDTIAVMNFPDGTISNASDLTIDENGDGHIDLSLAPKEGGIVTLPPFDSIAPTTIASTTGILGTNNWFTSNVTVQLFATDNDSGVASTTYSLNNGGTWIEYSVPVIVSTEGSTTVLYYSTDAAGNREAMNTLTLQIDKTAPEAMISVSTSTQDLLVEGKDAQGMTTMNKDTSGNFTITDSAGHTTKLFFTKTYTGKRLTYAKLTGIQYDSTSKITLPVSSFVYLWDTKTPSTLLSQTIAVDGTYIIQAVYDKSKNKTTVLVLKKGIPIKTQTFAGLRIPKLTSSNGVVGYSL